MNKETLPLQELFHLLPEVEELEEVRLSFTGASAPDPDRVWSKSGTYSTIDKWSISPSAITGALTAAENFSQARLQKFFETYRKIIEAAIDGEQIEALLLLVSLGEEEARQGRFQRARKFLETALALSLPLPDKQVQVLALHRIARVLRSQGELNEALAYYERSGQLARDSTDLSAEIAAYIGAATIRGHQGLWARAEEVCRVGLELIEAADSDFPLERGHIYNNLAVATTRQNRFAEAEEWLERAQALWSTLDSPSDAAICYFNTAVLRKRQGRREEAIAAYHKALSLESTSAVRAIFATDLAQAYAEHGQHSASWEWAREAERQAVAARSPYALGHMYLGLGNLARAQGQEDGLVFYEKALEIARKKSLRLLEGEALLAYAMLRKEMNETDEARAYLERAKGIFESTGMVHESARVEEGLAEIARTKPEAIAG